MSEIEAGRTLDALIAERVMGLTVIAHDWPCGWADWDDGGGYVAASERELPEGRGYTKQDYTRWKARYPERGPVYADPLDIAPYTPVPFYSTEIAAAWQVVEAMTHISRAARQESTRFAYWWDHARLWADTAAEAALEICGAALRAVQAPMAPASAGLVEGTGT